MSTMAMAPTLLTALTSQSAFAATCAPTASSLQAPVIIIDLAGGANLVGSNVMVGMAGGQMDYLANYQTMGLPPDFHPSKAGKINTEMGLAFHGDSALLKGLKAQTSTLTRANVDGAIFCHASDDDTTNNQTNPLYWLSKAGASGKLMPTAGTNPTLSGANCYCPVESVNAGLSPVQIDHPDDVVNLVSLGNLGSYFAQEPSTKIEKFLNTVSRLSERKIASLKTTELPADVKNLIQCGIQKTAAQVKAYTPDILDPRLDPIVKAIFTGMDTDPDQRSAASIGKLVIDGYVGVASIAMGGFDYHNQNREDGEIADKRAGMVIGKLLELASRKKKDLVIFVITDGGTVANSSIDSSIEGGGKFRWTSDSSQRSGSIMFVHKYDGAPSLRVAERRQIGHYKSLSQTVDTAALAISNSVVNTSKAMVANYLALYGREGSLSNIVGDNPFSVDYEKYLVFNRIR